MLFKKGAMFGLDARIALAIFGALSVISGAALYSAIQQSKAVAEIAVMEEIGKAIEAYLLDTGQLPTKMNASNTNNYFYSLKTRQLVDNVDNVTGWNGPYLNYEPSSTHLYYPAGGTIWALTLTNENTFGDGQSNWPAAKCTSGKKCFLYVTLNNYETDDLAKAMDQLVDGGDGGAAGKMRWYYESPTVKYSYFYQYSITDNPND